MCRRAESLERVLAEFAEYRRELEEVRAKIREAEESMARGEGDPLDVEALIARVDKRWELEQSRREIQQAIESSERGESKPLDVEDVKHRGRERMVREGIVD